MTVYLNKQAFIVKLIYYMFVVFFIFLLSSYLSMDGTVRIVTSENHYDILFGRSSFSELNKSSKRADFVLVKNRCSSQTSRKMRR